MKTALSVALIVFVAIASLTCGSDDVLQLIPNQPPPSGDVLTDEQRMAVFDECRAFVDALGDITSEAAQQAIVTWLKARPEFEEAGIESGNVWAYFDDGQMVTILPDWLNKDETGGRLPYVIEGGKSSADGESHVTVGGRSDNNSETSGKGMDAGGRGQGIPEVKAGILFYGLGTAFQDDRNHLEIMFETGGRTEYKLTQQDATIDNLKAVKDSANAVVYILTHGGIGFKKIRILGERVFSLWTKDTLTAANQEKYKDDVNNGVLSYQLALQNEWRAYECHYAITQEFVKQYMSFAENAIVYVDACNSMNEGSKAFSDQVLDKCAKQKGTYVGWTKPMNAITYIPTARYIFDRMIGANDEGATQQNPPLQRPFDFVSAYEDMLTFPEVFHLGVSSSGGRLAYNSRSTSEVLLVPSISYITMYDWESIMVIHGMFSDGPPDQGHVFMNGSEVSVTLWTKKFIICKIDDDGADSFGEVWVMYNDQFSNAVPLTSWTIPLTVTRDEGGIKTEATLTLRLRGDVHPYRVKPNDTPVLERPDSLGAQLPADVGWQFGKVSTGHYSLGGSRQADCTIGECSVRDTYSWKPAAGDLPYDFTLGEFRYGATYLWSRDLQKITVRLGIYIPGIDVTEGVYMNCPRTGANNHSSTEMGSISVDVPSEDFDVLEFELDENYNIIVGDKPPKTRTLAWGQCNETITLSTQIKWGTVNAQSPPTAETAARVGL